MKTKSLHISISIILLSWMTIFSLPVFAYNVGDVITTKTVEGIDMKFTITSLNPRECEVNNQSVSKDAKGSITIPEKVEDFSVTSIGGGAFYGCSGLTSITIPNSVINIGGQAFARCTGLSSIIIPDFVKAIGNSIFYGCTNLTSIRVENGNTIFDSRNNCNAIIETSTNKLIAGCKNTVIPNSVTSIGYKSFLGCSSLPSIFIPYSVMKIEDRAFARCSGLTSIEVENGNKYYDSRNNCNAIIETTTNKLIAGCQNTIIPNSVTSIGDEAFYSCGLTSITIGNSVTSIGTEAFAWCSNLTSVIIPNSVTRIGLLAFQNCTSLTSITIPNSVTSIGTEAFFRCSGLTSITIPNSVTSIGTEAFGRCTSIKEVHSFIKQPFAINEDVFQNGDGTFTSATLYVPYGTKAKYQETDGWKNFTNIVEMEPEKDDVTLTAKSYTREYGEANPTFGYEVTSGTITSGQPTLSCTATKTSPVGTYDIIIQKGTVSNKTVNLVKGTLTITKAPLTIKAGSYTKEEGQDNPEFTLTYTGFKNSETKSVLTKQPTVSCNATKDSPAGTYTVSVSGAEARNYTISYVNGSLTITPKPVVSNNITFADAEVKRICVQNWDTNGDGGLSKIEAAEVKDLGGVFSENTKVKFFNELQYFTGLTSIGDRAFYNCENLTSITIPNSVTSIGELAFCRCSGLTSVTIGNSVTSIGYGAFADCRGLTSITIPNSVTSIGERAFDSCTGLVSINIENGNNYYDSRENCNAIIETSTNRLIAGCQNTIIPNSVTSIGEYAFCDCSGLTSITIPNSVTSIEYRAFRGCENLTSITIPNSMTSIGEEAFYNCSSLTSIIIPNSMTNIGDWTFYGCSGLTSVTIPNSVTCIGELAFAGCSGLTSVTIGNSVTSIGDHAFSGCSGLTSITIPNSVTSIGSSAISGCTGLTSITVDAGNTVYDSRDNCNAIVKTSTNELIAGCQNTIIPNSVTSIGERAFSGCSSLTSVTIPNSVTSIGERAFSYCSALTSITIPNSMTSIGYSAFRDCTGLISITIPNSVTSIGNYAFEGCTGLISITIPNSVTSIGYDAFSGCTGLTSITIGNSVTSIGSSAFSGCSGLTSIIIGNSVTSIRERAFQDCTGLTSVTIPNSVTSIERWAFLGCSGLKDVFSLIELPFAIPTDVFQYYDDNYSIMFTTATLHVPIGTKSKYQETEGWKNFTNIVEEDYAIIFADAEVKRICVWNWDINSDGELSKTEAVAVKDLRRVFNNNRTIQSFNELQYFTGLTSIGDNAFYGCSGLTSISIPNSVTSIGDLAFYGCSGQTSITIPNSVTRIGREAFYNCSSLTSITIPNSVTSIGDYAFLDCAGLISITIPNSVTSIGSGAFYRCSGLTSINIENGNNYYDSRENCNAIIETSTNRLIAGCQNTIIPNSVTSIGEGAFYNCSGLTSVTIPNSVTSIGDGAFFGCSGLISITIPNSVTSIGNSAFSGCTGLTSIIIPNSVTSIGDRAFKGCTGLTSFVVESENKVYDSRGNCNAIIKISTNELVAGCQNTIIPNSVTSIGDGAFSGCTGLTSITIPNSVTSIGGRTFEGCDNLKEVHSKIKSPFNISVTVFYDHNESFTSATLFVPYGTRAKYQTTEGWKEFSTIVEEAPAKNITLADAEVKRVCVQNWDSNGDGEFSEDEAAEVMDLGEAFKDNKAIRTFHELQYFTNLTDIKDNAFQGCSNLTEMTIPATITSVGENAFNDAGLLSLIWESSANLTTKFVERLKDARPNVLIFVKDEGVVPNKGMENVVVNGVAENLVLKENSPFYSAYTFTAQNASFTHRFSMETGKGVSAGWETIALPFDVQSYLHETKGEITPFAQYTAGGTTKPFWLYRLTSNGFVEAKTIEAYKPYLISMPNNKAYYANKRLNGKVQFMATDVTIKRTDETEMTNVSYEGKTLRPTFWAVDKGSTVYAINATGDFSTDTGGETAGSIFIKSLRTVRPFEAYFDSGTSNAREFITIDFADNTATDISCPLPPDSCSETIHVYNLAGQLVYSGDVLCKQSEQARSQRLQLPSGVYVVNGKKVVIK